MQEIYDEYLDFLFFNVYRRKEIARSGLIFSWYNDNDHHLVIQYIEENGELWITPWLWETFERFFDLHDYDDISNIMSNWAKKKFDLGPINKVDNLPF